MDSEVKKQIKSLVLNLRKLFEDDLAVVLKRYGIFTDRAWLSIEKIPKADDKILQTRQRLEAAMQPNLERGVKKSEAARLYVREAGFTYLNRLVGLKVLEVRNLFPETIQTRPEYGGRSLYQRDFRAAHPELTNAADDALPAALEAACREVSQLIRFVFDVESEASILWPRYAALKEAIRSIDLLPIEIWQEDEIIGWIYQFYNAEEKEEIRSRGKPNLPIEVAVINQFFTPRWVVKYLVDNTLGRLWLEMHPNSRRVRAKCDNLVPEPLGVPKNGQEEGKIQVDPDSPVNNPAATPRRESKRPQDIRLIDPACGTMHFGHYAFEVFQEIYRDAREQCWVEGEDALEDKDIPLSILKHNLYGVDIDLRAVQLAAISLYAKARTSQRIAGMDDREAVRLPWSVNLVCADAHLTNGGMRKQFLEAYADDPILQKAWKELFREMEDIAQVGSLLRVEERFQQILAEYNPPSVENLLQKENTDSQNKPQQMNFGDIKDAELWQSRRSLNEMISDLQHFANDALDEHNINAQIFATEAEKTLSLLDILMAKYDVVVMNPPYGQTIDWKLIPGAQEANKNLYCAFLLRSGEMLTQNGYVGALTDRTYLLLYSFRGVREQLLERLPIICGADLGWEVLDDANVAVIAGVFSNKSSLEKATFIRCVDFNEKEKITQLEIRNLWKGVLGKSTFLVDLSDFRIMPTHPFCYWAPVQVRQAFKRFNKFEPTFGIVRKGISPGDTPRFVRQHWEISESKIGLDYWAPYANGGFFSPYYRDNRSVVLWSNNGEAIKSLKPRSVIRSEQLYGKSGLTFASRHHYLNVQFLEEGHIFSNEGFLIRCKSNFDQSQLAGLLNSSLILFMINLMAGLHKQVSHVKNLPIPEEALLIRNSDLQNSLIIHEIRKAWDDGNEICTHFDQPWILQVAQSKLRIKPQGININSKEFLLNNDNQEELYSIDLEKKTIKDLLDYLLIVEHEINLHLRMLQEKIDQAVYAIFHISEMDRKFVEKEQSNRPDVVVWPEMEGKSKKEKRMEHTRRLLSYFLLKAIRNNLEGIIPLTKIGSNTTIIEQLRQLFESEFGEEGAFQHETEIEKELGKYIGSWIENDFSLWHNKLYEKRPIVWHITSPKGIFSCFIYYHKLKRNTLLSVRTVYLWRLRDSLRAELIAASEKEDYSEINKLEEALTDIEEFDQALATVIDSGWDPDIDAGVKANILPLQEAGLLRHKVI